MLRRILNLSLREVFYLPFIRIPLEWNYQIAKQKYATHLPVLSSDDLTCVNSLKNQGVFLSSLDKLNLASTPKLLQASHSLIPELLRVSPQRKNQYYIEATPTQINNYLDIFLWGLEEKLINIAEKHLGLPVFYMGPSFRRDLVNGMQIKSRRWHIDHEDRHMLKIFIYLNDVNEDGGPFQYIPRNGSELAKRLIRYRHSTVSDKVMQSIIPACEWKSSIGNAGTVIFADTGSIFHRGKVPLNSERFVIIFSYTSKFPKNPHYCKSIFYKQQLNTLANSLSSRQRNCLFMR
ncbi:MULTISPECIES: hypothetical protein [unclassified Anabaena]|uniref:hypothetical protein n=1 Tax=unclassified Anabaena TaxID=2619674 RepID=UPI00082E1FA6|nr:MULTISPECIES: hypothetical protein [unclassified Anabaena]